MKKLSSWLKLETFEDPKLNEMVGAIGLWIEAVKNKRNPRWLSLIGNSGTGKTHCAKRLWKWITEMPPEFDVTRNSFYQPHNPTWLEFPPHIIAWPSFLSQRLRRQEFDEYNDMQRWPFLVLDDVGSERDSTGFSTECLYTLLLERAHKWTIITSNLRMKDFAAIDNRIADRMIRSDNLCVELTCASYSLRKKINP